MARNLRDTDVSQASPHISGMRVLLLPDARVSAPVSGALAELVRVVAEIGAHAAQSPPGPAGPEGTEAGAFQLPGTGTEG